MVLPAPVKNALSSSQYFVVLDNSMFLFPVAVQASVPSNSFLTWMIPTGLLGRSSGWCGRVLVALTVTAAAQCTHRGVSCKWWWGLLCSMLSLRARRACTGNSGETLGLTGPGESLQVWWKVAKAAGSVGDRAFGLEPSSARRAQQEQGDPAVAKTISPAGIWRLSVFSPELLGSLGRLLMGQGSWWTLPCNPVSLFISSLGGHIFLLAGSYPKSLNAAAAAVAEPLCTKSLLDAATAELDSRLV